MTFFKNNKVVYVLNSLIKGYGVEKVTLEEILFLKKKGMDVDVVVLREIGNVSAKYKENDIKVYYIPVYKADESGLKINFFYFLKFIWFLLKKRYGVLIGAIAPSHYFMRLAAFPKFNRKILVYERTNLNERKPKYQILDRIFSLWTDKIICSSQFVQNVLVKTCQVPLNKTIVIEHGYYVENQKKKEADNDIFIFGTVGQLIPSKNHATIIKAFALVVQHYSNCKLIIIGDGILKDELQKQAEELGVIDKIDFVGYTEDPNYYYQQFDCFLFTSVSEGLGCVFIEALWHKLPVICSNVPPMNDYITHLKNGILCGPYNYYILSNYMLQIINNRALREKLATNGYQTAIQKFHKDKQLSKLFDVIKK